MILEVAILPVIAGKNAEFEAAFRQASSIISSMKGYISHELQTCIEDNNKLLAARSLGNTGGSHRRLPWL